MKKLIRILLTIFLFSNVMSFAQSMDSSKYMILKNDVLKGRISKYINSLKDWGNKNGIAAKVFTLSKETSGDKDTYIVSALLTRVQLESKIPSYYTKIKDNIVLIYTGLEEVQRSDYKFLSYLKSIIASDIYNNKEMRDYAQTKTDSVYMVGIDGKRTKISLNDLGQDIDTKEPHTYLHPPIYELTLSKEYIEEKEVCNYTRTSTRSLHLLK